MLKQKIFTCLLNNHGVNPLDVAAAIGESMSDIILFLYESRNPGYVQFNEIDCTWTMTKKGARYAFNNAIEAPTSKLNMAIDPAPPTGGSSVTYPKPNLPGPKPRHMVQVSSLLKKPFLESPEDVEEFLSTLRTELTNTLARGERIQIK